MKCIMLVKYNLKVTSRKIAEVSLSKGLKQGNPLSPYLLIIVVDVLSRMVTTKAEEGVLEGDEIGKMSYPYSFFGKNDSLFFLKVEERNAKEMRKILDEYFKASG